jgi:hypothetical protein
MRVLVIIYVFVSTPSRDTAVGLETGYGMDGRGVGVRDPVGERFLFLSTAVKRPVRKVDHSRPTAAQMENIWIYISTPPYIFMA